MMIVGMSASTIMGCAKCLSCKKDNQKIKFCDKDEVSQSKIDVLVAGYEASGYTCKQDAEIF